MNFLSDNVWGAWPEMLAAIEAAAAGPQLSYGEDEISARVEARFCEVFERRLRVFPVISGTAANALGLSTLVPGHGVIFCREGSHIAVDECGAAEFYTQGARLVTLPGHEGKLSPREIGAALAQFQRGLVHHSQPAAISITQASEVGTVYSREEVSNIAELARANGLKLHMDGARVANALAHLDCTPAEATWKAGVDVLSFGATKGGALGAEAVVFFDPDDVRDFEYRRKRAGHLASKLRFVSAQLEAYLADDRWLGRAKRANACARRLAEGIAGAKGAELVHPVQSNAVLVRLPDTMIARLRAEGARFYDWEPPSNGRTLVRLVTSFATPEGDIARLVALASGRSS
jgi:threonine aldolase